MSTVEKQKEINPNEKDEWVVSREGWLEHFSKHGPAWQTSEDINSGQVGTAIRDVLRDYSIIRLFKDRKIDFKTLLELLSD